MILSNRQIFSAWEDSFDRETSSILVQKACNSLIKYVYMDKFTKHLSGSMTNKDLRHMLDSLKGPGCKLSDKTKKELPSYERVETTFRNINWLLQYWLCRPPQPKPAAEDGEGAAAVVWDYSSCYPNPISTEFGFAIVASAGRKKKAAGGAAAGTAAMKVQWLDEVLLAEEEGMDDEA